MIRILFALVMLGLAGQGSYAQETVRVGFRADAPPFSFRDGSQLGYRGFLAELCEDIVDDAGLVLEPVEISAETRFEMLSRGGQAQGIDLLCDPTSVNGDRMSKYLLSPIVFATGAGYLRHSRVGSEDEGRQEVLVGFLRGTTAGVAVDIARNSAQVIKTVSGGTIKNVEVDDHNDGITRVCGGELDFYFGDIDILRAVKAHLIEDLGLECDRVHSSEGRLFSYEAYALATNADRPDLALLVQQGVFRAFSDGRARDSYARNFDRRMGTALKAVFALNAVLPCGSVLARDPCR
ncbi:transporter substrate-binding domain-containing protein [Paracoccus sp. Z330]|uniref:Transporter substrate-binding domain-containing protein n=1 Tax=Paracoccus onchidii TaxID=3017813 RepID=A0ABT4ZHB9_9RHOB|nr:transporter substrate-binding domain-containing protein [Paracoccus onchidii]MDB6178707.1 transporter substrate-binding domain-containing protein [Paracoccus onchidii]